MNKKIEQKTNKGKLKPSEELVNSTLELVKNVCTTNDQTFIIRNIVDLINKGLESNVRNMIYLLKEHGNDTRMMVKDDKTVFEHQREYGIPASNIAYSLLPIANGMFQNKIDMQELTEFNQKTGSLLCSLEETEQLAINIIAKNNINTDGLPGPFKRMIENKKIQIAETIKSEKKKEAETLKLKKQKEQEAKKKQLEKLNAKKEKRKLQSEARKKEIMTFLDSSPKSSDKTNEEWIAFAKEKKFRLDDKLETTEDIFNNIIKVANIVIGNVKKEDKKIIDSENEKINLPSIDSKTKEEWIAFAAKRGIDLAGATLKNDIYDLIKLDCEK